jgi:hypothetical protein
VLSAIQEPFQIIHGEIRKCSHNFTAIVSDNRALGPDQGFVHHSGALENLAGCRLNSVVPLGPDVERKIEAWLAVQLALSEGVVTAVDNLEPDAQLLHKRFDRIRHWLASAQKSVAGPAAIRLCLRSE